MLLLLHNVAANRNAQMKRLGLEDRCMHIQFILSLARPSHTVRNLFWKKVAPAGPHAGQSALHTCTSCHALAAMGPMNQPHMNASITPSVHCAVCKQCLAIYRCSGGGGGNHCYAHTQQFWSTVQNFCSFVGRPDRRRRLQRELHCRRAPGALQEVGSNQTKSRAWSPPPAFESAVLAGWAGPCRALSV